MNILLLGKPGSGKGSITQELVKENFAHLATGDLLRAEEASGSQLGKEIGALLAQGKFATDETIFVLVNNFLENNKDKSVIFDGFPRNVAQTEKCLEMGIVFDNIFYIEVSDDTVKQRIVNRRVHPASGRVYNTITMPPKVEGFDDITGEPLFHRKDDYAEVLEKRLDNFNTLTQPIVNKLEQIGYIVNKFDGEQPIKEQITFIKDLVNSSKNKKLKM